MPSWILSRSQRSRSWSFLEQDQLAGGADPPLPAGVVQQQQGQQPQRLALVGHQLGQDPPQAHRLGAQLPPDQGVPGAGGIALVEDQVEDGQHRAEPLRQQVVGRHPVGDGGVADLALGPDQPLGHGRLREHEGVGDLGRGQPPEGAEGQGDPGLGRQGRVAAGEDQPQPVVGDGVHLGVLAAGRLEQGQGGPALGQPALAAEPVDGLVAGGGDDPGPGPVGDARGRPALDGDQKGLLDRVLGEIEVAEDADEGGHGLPGLLPEHPLDQRTGIGGHPHPPSVRTACPSP
jgi:hypothetical protein